MSSIEKIFSSQTGNLLGKVLIITLSPTCLRRSRLRKIILSSLGHELYIQRNPHKNRLITDSGAPSVAQNSVFTSLNALIKINPLS